MSNLNDTIQKARGEAQDLHKKIEASTAKNHAAIRTDMQHVVTQANELNYSIKSMAQSEQADAKQHLKDAASALEDAANHAKMVASASDADVKKAAQAALARAHAAVQSLSAALAAKRATTKV